MDDFLNQDGTGRSACILCPDQKFAAGTGSETCTLCPEGYHRGNSWDNAGAAGITSWLGVGTRCHGCNAGHFNADPGSHCKKCAAGKHQHEKTKTSCKNCPSGYFRGANGIVGNLYHLCYRRYCNEYNDCQVACCSGTTCASDTESQQIYNHWTALTAAQKLERHLFDPLVCTLAECDFCVAGYSQPGEGKLECVKCSAGKYQATIKTTTCDQCAKGQAAPLAGQNG